MELTTRDRTELKSYFVKNAIPTESNFSDFIDAVLNQKDDGIAKLPGNPLSIEASGDDSTQKKTLNFYRSFADDKPSWVINLNPRSDPAKPDSARPGFNISDGEGNNRLFIDRNSGNVGIGTISPIDQFNVAGNVRIMSDSNPLRFTSVWSGFPDQATNQAEISNDTASFKTLMIVGNKSNGGVRRVSIWDKLEVNGELAVTAALSFGSKTRQMINLWRTDYGIGIQSSTQYYRTAGHFAWYKGGSHHNSALNPGGGTVQMVIKNGNVGIGTINPGVPMEVNGDIKTNVALISDNPHGSNYAAFSHKNQGTAGGYALLQHKDGETYLNTPSGKNINIRVNNATKMRIISTGNVGIGTANPSQKFDVRGNIHYSGTLTKLDVANNFTATVRAADFRIGHSTRRGSSGRALVDAWLTLNINHGGDWKSGVRYYVSLTKVSSRKFKENIIDLTKKEAFRLLEALNPVKFSHRADELKRLHLGFIAEETPAPIVSDDGQAIDNDHIVAVLTQVVKEQQKAMAALSAKVNRLETQGAT